MNTNLTSHYGRTESREKKRESKLHQLINSKSEVDTDTGELSPWSEQQTLHAVTFGLSTLPSLSRLSHQRLTPARPNRRWPTGTNGLLIKCPLDRNLITPPHTHTLPAVLIIHLTSHLCLMWRKESNVRNGRIWSNCEEKVHQRGLFWGRCWYLERGVADGWWDVRKIAKKITFCTLKSFWEIVDVKFRLLSQLWC